MIAFIAVLLLLLLPGQALAQGATPLDFHPRHPAPGQQMVFWGQIESASLPAPGQVFAASARRDLTTYTDRDGDGLWEFSYSLTAPQSGDETLTITIGSRAFAATYSVDADLSPGLLSNADIQALRGILHFHYLPSGLIYSLLLVPKFARRFLSLL